MSSETVLVVLPQDLIDPRDFAVNLRFKNSHVLHPRARNAMESLASLVTTDVLAQGFEPTKDCLLDLTLVFPNRQSDLDGPVKRIMDGLERGIKEAGFGWWNDRYVYELHVSKVIGKTPSMGIILEAR